jgi:hypothetical protein
MPPSVRVHWKSRVAEPKNTHPCGLYHLFQKKDVRFVTFL